MTIGEKIKSLRKSFQMTQTELGAKLGVQKNAVSKWECARAFRIEKVQGNANTLVKKPCLERGWYQDRLD